MLRIGRYQLVHRLAEGAFGEVYVARQSGAEGFGRTVAVKKLRTERAESEAALRRFRHEAMLGARLDHANIVRVVDFVRTADGSFLVMDFVEGVDLRRLVEGLNELGRVLPANLVVEIGIQVCRGLDYAHTQVGDDAAPLAIVHRDLKPENLMLAADGLIKILDFGIARSRLSEHQTRDGSAPGTLAYMSPQRLRGGVARASDDVFAVGAILFELAMGEVLFDGRRAGVNLANALEEARGDPLAALELRNEGLGRAVRRAVAGDQTTRFGTAAALGAALRRVAEDHRGGETLEDLARMVTGVESQVGSASEEWGRLASSLKSTPSPWRTSEAPGPLHGGTTLPPPLTGVAPPEQGARSRPSRRGLVLVLAAVVVLALLILQPVDLSPGDPGRAGDITLPPSVRVPAGSYQMGSTDLEDTVARDAEGENSDELTPWTVVLDHALEVAVTETTQGEWLAAMGYNPAFFVDPARPVECVTLPEVAEFANRLSRAGGYEPCYEIGCDPIALADQSCELSGRGPKDPPTVVRALRQGRPLSSDCPVIFTRPAGSCSGYRLPYEEEWEYFARAGSLASTPWGTAVFSETVVADVVAGPPEARLVVGSLDQFIVHAGNSGYELGVPCHKLELMSQRPPSGSCGTQPTGSREANAWGLFDVLGNVSEMTQTLIGTNGPDYLPDQLLRPHTDTRRQDFRPPDTPLIARGGSWFKTSLRARLSQRELMRRGQASANTGFRLVRTVIAPEGQGNGQPDTHREELAPE